MSRLPRTRLCPRADAVPVAVPTTNCAARSRALIEILNHPIVGRNGGPRGGACAGRVLLQHFDPRRFPIELVQRVALGGQRSPIRFEPHAIDFRDRRHAARHAADRADIIRGQQQLNVTGVAPASRLDEPLLDARRLAMRVASSASTRLSTRSQSRGYTRDTVWSLPAPPA